MYLVPGNYQAPDRGDLCRTHNLGSNLGKLRQGGGLPRAAAMDWNGHCVGLCGSLRDGIHERCHPSVEVRRVPAKYRRPCCRGGVPVVRFHQALQLEVLRSAAPPVHRGGCWVAARDPLLTTDRLGVFVALPFAPIMPQNRRLVVAAVPTSAALGWSGTLRCARLWGPWHGATRPLVRWLLARPP